jgi:multicomponent K+:H+ antiporter subunit D
MEHWIIAPVVLPAVVASLLVLAARFDVVLQRVFSLAATAALVAIALALAASAATGTIEMYQLGNWEAPFGIVLVLDRLSAMMLLITAVLALLVLTYVIGSGWDTRGRHFHPLFQFQLMGLCGAMLTGDLFNLFVFFEVLLIASYGLMVHGGGKLRLQAGVQYVIFNLAGSALFLFALATLYGVTGTLNMADMAVKAAELPAGDAALLRTGAAMLLMVFAVKGALVPLHFWLPNTYTHTSGPIAALFSVMTKVGAYAILRVFTLIFGPGLMVTDSLASDWILPAAIITTIVGMVGILAGRSLARIVAYSAIGSMGTLFIAVSIFTPLATQAALYYLIHSTFAAAALFLIVDTELTAAPPLQQSGLIGAMFFAAAIAMAGLPPFSGFVGKLLVLDATRSTPWSVLIWAVILITSLIAVMGFARAGSRIFWKSHAVPLVDPDPSEPHIDLRTAPLALVSVFAVLAVLVGITVFAGPLNGYLAATAEQLYDPSAYIAAVLGQN